MFSPDALAWLFRDWRGCTRLEKRIRIWKRCGHTGTPWYRNAVGLAVCSIMESGNRLYISSIDIVGSFRRKVSTVEHRDRFIPASPQASIQFQKSGERIRRTSEQAKPGQLFLSLHVPESIVSLHTLLGSVLDAPCSCSPGLEK